MTSVYAPMLDAGEIVCEVCDDSGWQRFECTGDRACGRKRRHRPHTYAVPCSCRPINSAYQDKVARSRRRAA